MGRRRICLCLGPGIVSAVLLCAGEPPAAGAHTIVLLSGAGGTPCAPDPSVTFTSTSVLTPQPAVVGTGAPADPCAVEDDLHLPGGSRCITTTDGSDVSAEFTIHFDLPSNFRTPVLDMLVKVDDVCDVQLNGVSHYSFCNVSFGLPPTHLVIGGLAYFHSGTNSLTFKVENSAKCALSPVARSGPDDAMNVQFEGTVTYETGGGINLGWNDCPSGAAYTQVRTFACDTNAGFSTIVGSWVAPSGIDSCVANEVAIDMMTSGKTLSPWWSLRGSGPMGCRPYSLHESGDFTAGPSTCFDYWQGGAQGGVSMDDPTYSGNRAHIKVLEGLPFGSPLIGPVPEGTEVYSFKINISNMKTVGSGSCGGCTDEACIVLQDIRVYQSLPMPTVWLSNPVVSQHVVWQGWSNPDPTQSCPAVTPAKQRTWGSIKAQYR